MRETKAEWNPRTPTSDGVWSNMDIAIHFRQSLRWTQDLRKAMERDGYVWDDSPSDLDMIERWLARNPAFAVDEPGLQPKEVASHFRRGSTWAYALKKAMEDAGWIWQLGMVELGRVEMFLGYFRALNGKDFGVRQVYASRKALSNDARNQGRKKKDVCEEHHTDL